MSEKIEKKLNEETAIDAAVEEPVADTIENNKLVVEAAAAQSVMQEQDVKKIEKRQRAVKIIVQVFIYLQNSSF